MSSGSPEEIRARVVAERRGLPFLLYRAGAGEQVVLELEPARERFTIGRTSLRNSWPRCWCATLNWRRICVTSFSIKVKSGWLGFFLNWRVYAIKMLFRTPRS